VRGVYKAPFGAPFGANARPIVRPIVRLSLRLWCAYRAADRRIDRDTLLDKKKARPEPRFRCCSAMALWIFDPFRRRACYQGAEKRSS